MGNDGGVVARRAGNVASGTRLLLEVADDGTLRHLADGKDVADRQCCLLAAVHKLASVHALGAHKQLLAQLVAVWVTEHHAGQGGTTSRVVDDLEEGREKERRPGEGGGERKEQQKGE